MSEFSAPSGPPPPKVPEGWKAQWNEQYSEWFYVNIYTKKSQWDKPMEPAHPPGGSGDAPPGAPPGYDHKSSQDVGPEKSGNAYASNNPYSSGHGGPGPDISEDEKLARQLQAEENSHSGNGSRGANESYYGGGSQPYSSQQQELPPRPQDQGSGGSRGFLGKLLGKNKVNQPPQSQPYGQQYGQQQYSQPPYNQQQYSQPPQGYGGGYPQQGYGPPAGGYGGGYPPPGGYGGYPPQQQAGRRTGGGGLGAAGGAALGGVAGLAGGMMLMDAIDDHDQEAYQEGYNDGQDNDYGGGDDGGDF